ncbi:MAG: glycosyltransferase family 9 protein [Planctomycetota bacterium]
MRVLLVRLSSLGDVVQGMGAAEALALARPDWQLTWVVQREFLPLFEGLAWLTAVPHDRRPQLRGMWRSAWRLRRARFDVALDLQGNWKSAVVCRASGAPRSIGSRAGRREPASRVLLQRLTDGDGAAHPARVALRLVQALAPDAEPKAPHLRATDAERSREAAAVQRAGLDPSQPFRVLVAGAADDPRSWPVAMLEREAKREGPPVLWLTGPAEREMQLPDGARALHHGPGELRRLVGLGAVMAASGGSVWGPDRGATHVLVAAGAAGHVAFGPQDPARTAPVGAAVLVRRDGPPCVPCRQRRCTHPEGAVCMEFDVDGARELGVVVPVDSRG